MANPVVRKIYQFSPELAKQIEDAARREGLNETEWVRRALKAALEEGA